MFQRELALIILGYYDQTTEKTFLVPILFFLYYFFSRHHTTKAYNNASVLLHPTLTDEIALLFCKYIHKLQR